MKKNKNKELEIEFFFHNGGSDIIIKAIGYKGRADKDEEGNIIEYKAQVNALFYKFDNGDKNQEFQEILFLHNFTDLIQLAQEEFEKFEETKID